ncbi:hypothetical protein IAU60_006382 [Kwoniella sp. DSM 27419]
MKYGKEFQQILDGSSFPPDWKDSAIEYRRLKKLIKNVVSELTSMGLSPDVLHKLLVTEDGASKPSPRAPIRRDSTDVESDEDVLEFEYDSPASSPKTAQVGTMPRGHVTEPQEAVIDLIPDPHASDDDDHLVAPHPHHHRKFRLRLLSEASQDALMGQQKPLRPMNVAQFLEAREKVIEASHTPLDTIAESRGRRVKRRAVVDGHGGAKAEYILTGDPSNPVPQLRLHFSASPSSLPLGPDSGSVPIASIVSSPSPSPSPSPSDSVQDTETEDEGSDAERGSSPSTPRGRQADIIPLSPTLNRVRNALSPIWAIASGKDLQDGMKSLALESPSTPTKASDPASSDQAIGTPEMPETPLADFALAPAEVMPEISTSEEERESHDREFIIPLSSDLAFFHLLTSALTSLSTFHARQQSLFKESVDNLCALISASISPSSAPEVYPIAPSPSAYDTSALPATRSLGSTQYTSTSKASKKDLYAWREIFSLWIESEIFESISERDRGERTVEEAEVRLKRFANEVIKRGLGDRRTMKGKKSRESWEEFLRLNVLLLDLKRFQVANINAARKILKKHDKRTALTASAGFPSFVRSTLSAHVDTAGNVSTWTFYNTSLPHVLLASLTSTLLPILPSLDDYACLICTSIAFKPIRLGCGHLFCVRCLVKMQRAGKDECPLCRSKVILLADKNSLDMTVMNFMKEWFPKEVKEKQKENELEMAVEQGRAKSATPKPSLPPTPSASSSSMAVSTTATRTKTKNKSKSKSKDKDEKCVIM